MTLRVVTWNVHGCVGADRRFDPRRIAATLRRLAPDLALLQEVGDARGVHPPVDQARALADALDMTLVLGVTIPRGHGYGNVTLSRLGRRAAATWDLSVRGREPRVCLCLEVEGPGGPLLAANVHLGLGRRERETQLAILLDDVGPLLAGDAPPMVVLGGDFNDWPPGAVTRTLERRFVDAARAAAGGRPAKTFPSRRPLLRLDRLYLGGALAVRACAVDASAAARAASDHLPLVAELVVGTGVA